MTKISDLHLFCDGCEIDLGDYSVSFHKTFGTPLLLIKTNLTDELKFNGNHFDVDVVFKDIESQQFYRSSGVAIGFNLIRAHTVTKQIQINLDGDIEKFSASETLLWKI